MKITKSLRPNELHMWLENARYDYELTDERECIQALFNTTPGKIKMLKLLEDIVEVGYLKESLIIFDNGDKKITLDGNRRLSLFKISEYPDLVTSYGVSDAMLDALEHVQELECYIYNDLEEAYDHVENRHQGELGGIGIIPWDSHNKERFKEIRGQEVGIGKKILDFFEQTKILEYQFVKENIRDISTISRIFDAKCIRSDKFLLANKNAYNLSNKSHTDKINELLTIFYQHGGKVNLVYTVEQIKDLFKDVPSIIQNMMPNALPIDDGILDKESDEVSTPVNSVSGHQNSTASFGNTDNLSKLNANTASLRNNLKQEGTLVFAWKTSEIDINNDVLKYYLGKLSYYYLDSSTSSGMAKFVYHSAPLYYRILLECAIKELIKFIKVSENQKKFNINNIPDATLFSSFIGTTNEKTSVVNKRKLYGVHQICKVINCQQAKKKVDIITKELQQMSISTESAYDKFVDDLNEIIHGTKIYLDDNTLKKYDRVTLSILQLISIIMK